MRSFAAEKVRITNNFFSKCVIFNEFALKMPKWANQSTLKLPPPIAEGKVPETWELYQTSYFLWAFEW